MKNITPYMNIFGQCSALNRFIGRGNVSLSTVGVFALLPLFQYQHLFVTLVELGSGCLYRDSFSSFSGRIFPSDQLFGDMVMQPET